MPQTQHEVIAECPNPKCKKAVYAGHPYTWCEECGEPLPDEIIAKLPTIQKQKAAAVAFRAAKTNNDFPADSTEGAVTRRYRDAYLVARATNGLGGVVKGIGVVLGILTALGTVIGASQLRADAATSLFLTGFLSAAAVGLCVYVCGVIVSALGQIHKANLDAAVNTSPFLTNEHRADIMSLPRPSIKGAA